VTSDVAVSTCTTRVNCTDATVPHFALGCVTGSSELSVVDL
jgi:hypothetical protein